MLQKHVTHPTRLFSAIAFSASILLSACSQDSTPIMANQPGPSASSGNRTEIQSASTTLSQDRNTDPSIGMTDGNLSDVPDTIKLDNTTLLDTITIRVVDTVIIRDTLLLGELRVDTVEVCTSLTGEWLRFSSYLAARDYIRNNFPARAGDRFSSLGEFSDYNAGTPAGRAGFLFQDNGDSTYFVKGYTFEHVFGAIGFAWGAREGRPTENTYFYGGNMRLHGDGTWEVLNLSIGRSGDYIRDTRHD